MVEHCFVRKYQPPAIPAKEAVVKDPEKKGTTKTRRHKVFSVLVWATLGRQKKSSFVPSCLGGSRLFTFCDTLRREEDGCPGFLPFCLPLVFRDSLMATLSARPYFV